VSVSRFAALAGMPERIYWRRLACNRSGKLPKGPWPEHLYRAIIGDGNALAVEVNCFRHTYNTRRPHQALGDRTPRQTYLAHLGATSHRAGQCS
jgi:Integrase core domain